MSGRERGPDATETSIHVRRSVDGDPASIGWIVEHFSPLLRAQARYRLSRHLRGLYDPEDLVQQVWLICLPKLGTLSARAGRTTPVLLRFLGTTLLRTYHHLVERHLANKPRVLSSGDAGQPAPQERATQIPDDVTGVVTRAVRHESRGLLNEAIESLTEPQREILVLRALEELPYRLAAMKLGTDEQNLRARYARALESLRHSFPPSMIDDLIEPA